MNRLQLQALAGRAVRRRLAQRPRGMSGLGSVTSYLQRLQTMKGNIQAFRDQLLDMTSAMKSGIVKDNARAYADTMDGMLRGFDNQRPDLQIQAGGDAGKEAVKMMNSYELLLKSRESMWDADLNDPSGERSKSLAQGELNGAQAKVIRSAENIAYWEKVTNIDNPFSPVGILSTIKKYAIWGLVIGGVVLSAPVLFPAIGKLIGHARKPQSAPKPVAANRRRR